MKKIVIFILTLLSMIYGTIMPIQAAEDIKVCIDGNFVKFDVKPQIIDGRTMVPIRAIFEAMGATVLWNDSNKTATCTKDNTVVKMTLGEKFRDVDGIRLSMDVAPVIVDGRILTPARYVAESFGYVVEWDGVNKIVNINYVNSDSEPVPEYLTDFLVIHEESLNEYIVYFGFKDINGSYLTYSGKADIKITNDQNENVYSRTVDVKPSMYDTYTRAYTGNQKYLLCKIKIPESEIKKGLSNMGECTLDFYSDEMRFGTVSDNLFSLPELKGNELAEIEYNSSFWLKRDKPSGAEWWELDISLFKITSIDMAYTGELKIQYEMQGVVNGNDYFSFEAICYDDAGLILGKAEIFHEVADGQMFRVNGFEFIPYGTTRLEFRTSKW